MTPPEGSLSSIVAKPPKRARPVWVAAAAALGVLVVVGGVTLAWRLAETEPQPQPADVPPSIVATTPAPAPTTTGPTTSDTTPTTTTVTTTSPIPRGEHITTLIDTADAPLVTSTGINPQILAGPDGNPVIVYVRDHGSRADDTAYPGEFRASIMLARCSDPSCATDVTLSEVALPSGLMNPEGFSAALLPDGSPVVLFSSQARGQEEENRPLPRWSTLLICGDPSCDTTVQHDIAEGWGWGAELAIGGNGLPVVVYGAQLDPDVGSRYWLFHCGDRDCNTGSTVAVTDPGVGPPYMAPRVVIGSDGNPVVAHGGKNPLVIITCSDPSCAGERTTQPIPGDIGGWASLSIGANGWPQVTYRAGDPGRIHVTKCTNRTCGETDVVTIENVGLADENFHATATALTYDGNDIYAWLTSHGEVAVTTCAADGCTASVFSDTPLSAVNTVSMLVPADGLPILVYPIGEDSYSSQSGLAVTKCGDPFCSGP